MKEFFDNYLNNFGEFSFGEINNMCMSDYERCFKRYFSERQRNYNSHIFGEINNQFLIDFEESIFNLK